MTRANKLSTEMTIREAMAMAAMQGILSCPNFIGDISVFCASATQYADALLAELAKTAPADTAPAADDWIPWGGGKCPVDGNTYINAKFRVGEPSFFNVLGSSMRWTHEGNGNDIVAYRIVKGGEA